MALSPFRRVVAFAAASAVLFFGAIYLSPSAVVSNTTLIDGRRPAPDEAVFLPLPPPPPVALEQPAPSAQFSGQPSTQRAGRVALRPRVGCRLVRAS